MNANNKYIRQLAFIMAIIAGIWEIIMGRESHKNFSAYVNGCRHARDNHNKPMVLFGHPVYFEPCPAQDPILKIRIYGEQYRLDKRNGNIYSIWGENLGEADAYLQNLSSNSSKNLQKK